MKMVSIADALAAVVQGDDGERYRADGSADEPERTLAPRGGPSLFKRVRDWFALSPVSRTNVQSPTRIHSGMRVRTALGETGTVIAIDTAAIAGLGEVRVQLDAGRDESFALVASGLEPI